jgi:hypothetical protein
MRLGSFSYGPETKCQGLHKKSPDFSRLKRTYMSKPKVKLIFAQPVKKFSTFYGT